MNWLLVYGSCSVLGYVGLLWLSPLQFQILPFLGIYAVLGLLYFGAVYFTRRNESKSSLFWILLFSVSMRVVMFVTPPSLSDDIYRYVWDGRVQKAGLNPYRFSPQSEELVVLQDENHQYINHKDIKTIYPPLAQMVFRIGAYFSEGVYIQKALFVIFDLGILWCLLLWIKKKSRPVGHVVAYAWNPLVVIEFSGSGHLDSLMLFLLMVALFFFSHGKSVKAAMALSGAVMAKIVPVVLIPWLLVSKNWKACFVFAATTFMMVLPFLSDLRPGIPIVGGWGSFSRDWVFNPGFYAAFKQVFKDPLLTKVFVMMVSGGLVLIWTWRARKNLLLCSFGALLIVLLFSPVVHPWYVTWLVPFLCFYPLVSVFYWSWIIALTYVVQIDYVHSGVWNLPSWVLWAEYGGLYSLLIIEGFGIFHRKIWNDQNSQWVGSFENDAVEKNEQQTRIHDPCVSIIIPALNEEQSLPFVLSEIPRSIVDQVIVVDNGSTDQTPVVASRAGAVVINESRRGYGQAVWTGSAVLSERCNIVVILDADYSDYPEDLSSLIGPIINGDADVVLGSRTEKAEPGALMPQQKFGNWLSTILIRYLYGVQFTDMGPFRALRKDSFLKLGLKDRTYGWNVEMQVKAIRNGMRIVEVPVRYRSRIGISKISGSISGSVRAGIKILWSLWVYGVGFPRGRK